MNRPSNFTYNGSSLALPPINTSSHIFKSIGSKPLAIGSVSRVYENDVVTDALYSSIDTFLSLPPPVTVPRPTDTTYDDEDRADLLAQAFAYCSKLQESLEPTTESRGNSQDKPRSKSNQDRTRTTSRSSSTSSGGSNNGSVKRTKKIGNAKRLEQSKSVYNASADPADGYKTEANIMSKMKKTMIENLQNGTLVKQLRRELEESKMSQQRSIEFINDTGRMLRK